MRRHLDHGVTVALMLTAGVAGAQLTPGSVGTGSSPSTGTGSTPAPSTPGATPTPETPDLGTPGADAPTTAVPGTGAPGGTRPTPRVGTGGRDLPPSPPGIAPSSIEETPGSSQPGRAISPAPALEPSAEAEQVKEGVTGAPDSEEKPARREPLTLARLVARAREADSRVEEATAELRKFQALYQQARWAWFPKFEITVGAGGPTPEARNDGLGGPPTTEATYKGDLNFGRVGVTMFSTGNAVLPLYTFGKLTALEKAGAQGPVLGAALRERTRNEVGFQAAQAYFGYQLARNGLQQIEEVSKRLEDAGQRIERLLKEDSAQVSAVDSYKVRFFRQIIEARKAEALQGRQFALAAIGLLANVGPEDAVTVVEEDLELEEDVPVPSLEQVLVRAEQSRPELTAVAAGIAAREQEVFIRERSYYPDLGLAGFYDVRFTTSTTRQRTPFAFDPFNDRTGGVGLVMRGTFDIPIKDAQLEQARAELDKLRAQEKQIRAGIRLEVSKVHGELVAAWSRARAFGEAERSARRWVTAAFTAFDLGTGDTRDLVDAFTAYAQASGDKGKSWHDVRVGMAALARVTGASLAPGE
ncbi:TolC family protein [Myxococcus xanthus]|uniref:TolC family protein n=1 Tax=Myxococcus xanthus TaxID=34 RepID=UPI0015756A8C|nr:TolC family protein [Myxococcus xanthus]